jgi:hypothetical protein
VRLGPDARVADAAEQGAVHGDDQRQRGITPGQGAVAEDQVGDPGALPAQASGYRQTEIAIAGEHGKAFDGERAIAVVSTGVIGRNAGCRQRALDDVPLALGDRAEGGRVGHPARLRGL